MALRPDNTLISNREMLTELVLSPFNAFVRWIDRVGESRARAQALSAIGELSDAQLAARGLTRADAIAMVFRKDG